MKKEKIIIADDAPLNRLILKTVFANDYEVLEAQDGEQAIELLEEHNDISAILLDLIMPKKNGLEVMSYMDDENLLELVPVIMITGEATKESDLKAYEYGAADIIYKPFDPVVIKRRVRNIIELYEQRNNIERMLEKKNKQLIEMSRKMHQNNVFLINALGSVIEFRDIESGQHVQRVSEFTKEILLQLRKQHPEFGLRKDQIEMISQAAALHDVGKIAVPDAILNKPGRYTPQEFEEMKKHTIKGCEILEKFKQEDSEFYKYCYEICRWHHEKIDGKGYPDGLKGDEIPLWSQATAVADCFDALVSKRVYKDAMPMEAAFQMILDGECGKFSTYMMEAFTASKDRIFEIAEIYNERKTAA